ncbi:hypothetical protein [Clostridium luticellarii]|jgi:hypothetical protein|uniref:Transporter n=1 Tax=Clostridium luticellarii TaxID=1691940 RepID=A0A2T0BSJ1_9CLOT|nr:hypothetical protein [Clostridium luticellarii]MCI1945543.1 hypothetical protein [Clostridium luticellarii]MCI1968898.1 hypothetical protein [Clostridium luticellarii]MCI1996387.1 hypothetical protein [Clostridium luticellarii]MCI2040716.1 hypothetical protein [Clostridium luticellarii]PRR86802.1 hypothetical protein CLLU_02860 [Clostridium luticellarii]
MYDYNCFRFEDEYDDIIDDIEPSEEFYCPYCQFCAPPYPMPMTRQQNKLPPGPPPVNTPSKGKSNLKSGPQLKAVDPGSLRPCIFKYVYIWPKRGNPFWAWITNVGRRSFSGYRWYRGRWAYFGMDLNQIQSFICY